MRPSTTNFPVTNYTNDNENTLFDFPLAAKIVQLKFKKLLKKLLSLSNLL